MADPFHALRFRFPFRTYQRLILARVEGRPEDRRLHLVAPPGSGKTIVGLELIRRSAEPAVVFAPTTTIQRQWRDQVRMFAEDDGLVDRLVSLDPAALGPLNVFTYQLISAPGDATETGRRMAEQAWAEELVVEGRVADDPAARERIAVLARNNPVAHRRELGRRYLALKRRLLTSGGVDVAAYLHPNAARLVDALVDHGVRTVVLDECHHLLDYWAIVLRHLIDRIAEPLVVGLTATLPSPDDDVEYENYTSLLGDVDFEVPTPAVVKEGDLAPYRDLAIVTRPSARELAYLRSIQDAFEAAIGAVTGTERFRDWLAGLVGEAAAGGWERFLVDEPLFSLAALRVLGRSGRSRPAGVPVPLEAADDPTLEDWASVLERFGLDVLKVSPAEADHDLLADLRRSLLPFGLTLTERGLRQGRSAGDLVLSLSESKDEAVARILAAESAALGPRLRAVVVTDFERLSSGAGRLRGVLDRDAGSARRVFRHLVAHRELAPLDPILVTGSTVMVDADHGQALLERFDAFLAKRGLDATTSYRSTDDAAILEVVGAGRGWTSGAYVRMVTAAFEAGASRCLVGTRGIFGEGWDALRLNVLVDLTTVTTSTSVQQLRGRTLRKDPDWPEKVAHNWDVVCVAPEFRRGDLDVRRLERRHGRTWGILHSPPSGPSLAPLPGPLGGPIRVPPEMEGRVVRGLGHVDFDLAYRLATQPFGRIDFEAIDRRLLDQVPDRERVRRLWRIGEPYTNFAYAATRLRGDDLRIRTVHTISDTLRRMVRAFRATLVGALGLVGWTALVFGSRALDAGAAPSAAAALAGAVLLVGTLVALVLNARTALRVGRRLLVEQPPDLILRDVGWAVLAGLQGADLVSRHIPPESVRVVDHVDGSFEVVLEDAAPADTATFIRAYRDVFEPVRDQRYLIRRADDRVPSFGWLWWLLRRRAKAAGLLEPAYHPVPGVLATRRERADAFAEAWRRRVGGGELVHTRSEAGRVVLLEARAQRRPDAKSLAFETWR